MTLKEPPNFDWLLTPEQREERAKLGAERQRILDRILGRSEAREQLWKSYLREFGYLEEADRG